MKEKTSSLHKPTRLGDALLLLLLAIILLGFPLLSASAQDFVKPDKDRLKQILTPLQYAVTQKDKTEPPYRNPFWDEKAPGIYVDLVSGEALFSSLDKYDSGTGWPSFTQALPEAMGTKRDFKLIVPRTEYHCARCGGHQGHVFNDGPRPTGQRWCNNGLALRFVPKGEAAPALRWPESA